MSRRIVLRSSDLVWIQLLGYVPFLLLYLSESFQPVRGRTMLQSLLILTALLLYFFFTGIVLMRNRQRNILNIAVNLLLPFELYLALVHLPSLKELLLLLGAGILAFYLLYFLTALFQRRGAGSLREGIWIARIMTALCLLLLFAVIFGGSCLDGFLLRTGLANDAPNATIANHLDTLRKLEEEVWLSLDTQQRLAVLQTVADIERDHLGIPHDLPVEADVLGEKTMGKYNDGTRKITVNLSYLNSEPGVKMLNVVCHEAYHAYQHRLVNVYEGLSEREKRLLVFQDMEQIRIELNTPPGSPEYPTMIIEADCRRYADTAVKRYLLHIEDVYSRER